MINCDECKNFPPPESKKWGDCTKRDYYCMAGLLMMFSLPESPNDDDWGFQKTSCKMYDIKIIQKPDGNKFIPVLVARKRQISSR